MNIDKIAQLNERSVTNECIPGDVLFTTITEAYIH